MLLLHGALGTASQFDGLRERLVAPGGVNTLDFLGHGAASLPDGPLTTEALVEQVVTFVEARALRGTPCFGYSMGGYVALLIAATRPGILGRVTTLATKVAWSPEIASREAAQLDPEAIGARLPRFAATLDARHTGAGWRALCTALAGLLRRLGDAPLLDHDVLSRITIPVKLMVGDRDTMVTIEETVTAWRAVPGANLAVLPGVQHPLERVPS